MPGWGSKPLKKQLGCLANHTRWIEVVPLPSEMFAGLVLPIWVCLKIGYIPNYSHLIGIMIINHWVWGYTIFRQTHLTS